MKLNCITKKENIPIKNALISNKYTQIKKLLFVIFDKKVILLLYFLTT